MGNLVTATISATTTATAAVVVNTKRNQTISKFVFIQRSMPFCMITLHTGTHTHTHYMACVSYSHSVVVPIPIPIPICRYLSVCAVL